MKKDNQRLMPYSGQVMDGPLAGQFRASLRPKFQVFRPLGESTMKDVLDSDESEYERWIYIFNVDKREWRTVK